MAEGGGFVNSLCKPHLDLAVQFASSVDWSSCFPHPALLISADAPSYEGLVTIAVTIISFGNRGEWFESNPRILNVLNALTTMEVSGWLIKS